MTQTDAAIPAGWEDLLSPGERILWQGAPDDVVEWSGVLSPLSAFGVFFGGFAAVWITLAFAMGSGTGIVGWIFPLFGLPFLAVGLFMAFGRLIWDARVRRGTHYTLTTRNGWIATDLFGRRKIKPWPVEEMELELEDGDPGTVWFAKEVSGARPRRRRPNHVRTRAGQSVTPVGFRRIPDARKVYRLCRDAQAAARAAAPGAD
ncbi:hypothetical protein ACQ5SO_14720 [Rhodovulum sp. DZ06]|uniref:hypothetical protein n=1 Tax=Rhodovulum sp. DZ06 TaxID=3425126 RepID=UPI003D34B8E7